MADDDYMSSRFIQEEPDAKAKRKFKWRGVYDRKPRKEGNTKDLARLPKLHVRMNASREEGMHRRIDCGFGYDMLKQMGWKGHGEGLGKRSHGIVEPIKPDQNDRKGIGSKKRKTEKVEEYTKEFCTLQSQRYRERVQSQQLAKAGKIIKDLDSRQGLDCTVLWPHDDWSEVAAVERDAENELLQADNGALEGNNGAKENKKIRTHDLAPTPGEWQDLKIEEQLSYAAKYLLFVHGYEFELDTED